MKDMEGAIGLNQSTLRAKGISIIMPRGLMPPHRLGMYLRVTTVLKSEDLPADSANSAKRVEDIIRSLSILSQP